MSRIEKRFAKLKVEKRKAFSTFVAAGDPDLKIFAELFAGLPGAGVDFIELGMPFSDPMADGVAIQLANLRAFKAGITLAKVLDLVRGFRAKDTETPLVLMGYYNPIYSYGVEKFLSDAKAAGADGLLVVDLPPEEDAELCEPAQKHGLDFIRLVTPTTDAKRLPTVLKHATGFLYYVSVAGITGTQQADSDKVGAAVKALRQSSDLPVMVGFGINTTDQAREIAKTGDAIVVGSAIVKRIAENLDSAGQPKPGLVKEVLAFVADLAKAAHQG